MAKNTNSNAGLTTPIKDGQANVIGVVGKGGAAKSLIAGAAASCASVGKKPYDLYDCDASNPSLKVMFGLPDKFVRNGEVDRDYLFETFDLMVTSAMSGKHVIADFGAGMEGGVFEFLEDQNFVEFASGKFNFTIVTPLTTIDSINNVKSALDCSAAPRVVVVQNEYYRRELELALKHKAWLEVLQREKKPEVVKLRHLGGTILEAKELRLPLHMLIDREESSAMTRHGAQHVLTAFQDAFSAVKDYMPWR